ncbi:MAG: GDSL family lipase [Bacteroidetes bacterium]|nr:GDSL family lipase [Bacteroidota bacterium]
MRFIPVLFFCVCLFTRVDAQTHPDFWNDVQVIKQYDKIYAPPKNPILFTGSSSIRMWGNLAEQFRGYPVLNRGIGGAVTRDIDRYVADIILPYKPRQIVLYIGENDILTAPNGDTVFLAVQKLFQHIRAFLPDVPVAYISIKPSPSRAQFLPVATRANELIRDYLATQSGTAFIDIYPLMLDKKGNMRPELFREDKLHMKQEGYDIWYKKIRPFLVNQ